MQLRRLLPLALCATTLVAQNDFDLEKRTSGRLGSPLTFDVVNAPPFALMMLIPSSTAGPTPLAIVDPSDPRALSVGVDLLSATAVLFADLFGNANYSLGLPLNPCLLYTSPSPRDRTRSRMPSSA